MNRRSVVAMLVAASLVGAAIPILISGQLPGGLGAGTEPAGPPPRSSEPHTPSPASSATGEPSPASSATGEETAGSARLAEDFDRLTTGEDVPGWEVDEGARLEVSALPTAVQRSARLSADAYGMACRALAPEMQRLTATFMVDSIPPGDVAALVVTTQGDDDVSVFISSDGSSTVVETPTSGPIEPHNWYRWSLVSASDAVTTSLVDADGTVLAEQELEARDALGDLFCLSTRAPARIHLDSLTVENP